MKSNKICPVCRREFKYNKNDVCSTCRIALLRYKQRKAAYAILGNICKRCGEDDSDVLTCHHRNPDDKCFELSIAWGNIAWDTILLELKKCDLVCSNCHLKIHAASNQKRFKLVEAYLGRVAERQTLST